MAVSVTCLSRRCGRVTVIHRYFSAVILAVPISFLVVWYKMLFTNDITPEMRAFPQYKFAIMAFFDTTFNVFSTFPVQHLG